MLKYCICSLLPPLAPSSHLHPHPRPSPSYFLCPWVMLIWKVIGWSLPILLLSPALPLRPLFLKESVYLTHHGQCLINFTVEAGQGAQQPVVNPMLFLTWVRFYKGNWGKLIFFSFSQDQRCVEWVRLRKKSKEKWMWFDNS